MVVVVVVAAAVVVVIVVVVVVAIVVAVIVLLIVVLLCNKPPRIVVIGVVLFWLKIILVVAVIAANRYMFVFPVAVAILDMATTTSSALLRREPLTQLHLRKPQSVYHVEKKHFVGTCIILNLEHMNLNKQKRNILKPGTMYQFGWQKPSLCC